MSPDELYALGYALQPSMWGVNIILEDPDHMNDDSEVKAVYQLHFTEPTPHEEACRRGWEFAAANYVQRRLDT